MSTKQRVLMAILVAGSLTGEPVLLRMFLEGQIAIVTTASEGGEFLLGPESTTVQKLKLMSRQLTASRQRVGMVLAAISEVH